MTIINTYNTHMHAFTQAHIHSHTHACIQTHTYTHQDNTVWHWRDSTPLKLLVKILYGGILQSFTLCEKVSRQRLLPQWLPVHVFGTGDPNTSYTHKCMSVHMRTHTHTHTRTWHRHSFQPPTLLRPRQKPVRHLSNQQNIKSLTETQPQKSQVAH